MSDGSVASSGRTALRVLAVVLLIVVVAPFVVTGMPAVIGAEESFVVLSGSMNAEPEPIIQPGDVVIVDGVNPANIEEQDIITFSTGADEPVTHRVVNVTEQNGQVAFRTKGDANEDADQQLIGPDQIIGEVIVVIPLIGHVVNFANTTQGFVLLVLLPIGLLVLSEAWNLVMADDESAAAESEPERSPSAGAAEPAVENEADADDDGPSTVSLGRAQMGWITLGLVPVSAAAGYMAFRLQTAWILTVFFASVGLTILSGLLYLRIRWGESGTAEPAGTTRPPGSAAATDGRTVTGTVDPEGREPSTALTTVEPVVEEGVHRNPVVTGRIENALGDGSHVEVSVDSREALVRMALEKGSWVVHDADAGVYVLVDDGTLFRYEEGTAAAEPSSNWEEESGWVTFSEAGTAAERANGSNGSTGHDDVDEVETGRTTDLTRSDADEPSVATDSESLGTEATDDVETTEETDVVPAIRRVDDTASSEEATDEDRPAEAEVDAEDDRPTPGGTVETDGGTTTGRSGLVGAVDRILRFPIRLLAVVGYLVVEPPATLYRALRSNDDEDADDPQSDTQSRGEP